MKTKYTERVEDYELIIMITDAVFNPEETRKNFESLVTEEMTDDDVEILYRDNPDKIAYSPPTNGVLISDEEAVPLELKIEELRKKKDEKDEHGKTNPRAGHERIANDGQTIPDWRGVSYWIKQDETWVHAAIEHIGVALPSGAVLQEELTPDQNNEIREQQEAARLAALTPDQKAAEKENALNTAKTTARIKKEEAEVADEEFNAKAWFQQRKAEIEAKYA
jgi:hypothetical protein